MPTVTRPILRLNENTHLYPFCCVSFKLELSVMIILRYFAKNLSKIIILRTHPSNVCPHWKLFNFSFQVINELILSTESKKLKLRKNVNSRTRSPASQSPASKSRKAAAAAATVTTSGKPRLDLSFFLLASYMKMPLQRNTPVTWPFCCHNTLTATAYQLINTTLYLYIWLI